MASTDGYSIDLQGTRQVVSNIDGLVSSGMSTAGDLGSMVLNGSAFGAFGSGVASANDTLQSQFSSALNQCLRLTSQINTNVATAADGYVAADQQIAQAFGGGGLSGAGASSTGPTDLGQSTIPAAGSAPADVKQWWDGLDQTRQQQLADQHHDQIGALDGVPAAVRDYANRQQLGDLTQQAQTQLDTLKDNPPKFVGEPGDEAAGADYANRFWAWNQQVNTAQTKLDDLHTVQNVIGTDPRPFPTSDVPAMPDSTTGTPPKYLLGIDTQGTGHAIIASNNPDAAHNVVTEVPGAETQLNSASVTLHTTRADQLVAAAGPSTSAVSWMNYNAPASALSVDTARSTLSQAAAPGLDQFQQGLYSTNGTTDPHMTMIGHSYGAVVIGDAATAAGGLGNLHVQDVVAVGTFGMDVPNAAALGVPGTPAAPHVWVGTADNDVAQFAPLLDRHNADPNAPGFGASQFNSGAGPSMFTSPSAAHSSYFDPGSPAMSNMGNIIAGRYDQVTPRPTPSYPLVTDPMFQPLIP